MDILIRGQEKRWVLELEKICKNDGIRICLEENGAGEICLLVTDFPIGWVNRGIYAKIPFLVVSKDRREEKVLEAFGAGAEDYMVYPVSPRIARARILRILGIQDDVIGSLPNDTHFTPNERKLLLRLAEQPGKVFTRDELLAGAFAGEYEGYDRNVDNYMKQIRKKLPKKAGRIETVYGVGYRYMP